MATGVEARTAAVADLPCGTEKIGRLYFHNAVNLFMCAAYWFKSSAVAVEFVDLKFVVIQFRRKWPSKERTLFQ